MFWACGILTAVLGTCRCSIKHVHDLLGSLLLHSFLHAGLAAGLLRNRRVCTHCGFSSSKSSPNQPSFGIKSIKPFRGKRVQLECAQRNVWTTSKRGIVAWDALRQLFVALWLAEHVLTFWELQKTVLLLNDCLLFKIGRSCHSPGWCAKNRHALGTVTVATD